MVFIPHRWWHMALNLDLTVAVTHNFVSTANVADVCQFLETSAAEVCVRTTLIDANGGYGSFGERRSLFAVQCVHFSSCRTPSRRVRFSYGRPF